MTDEGLGGISAGESEHPTFDSSVAHQARVYDYWLGGKDNYAADRAAGDAAIAAWPAIVAAARANRAYLGRVVRYLTAEAGIRQFLDIGTGIPAANNTHQVAQAVAPECRVVYVDYDPVVLAHARALLTSGDQGATAYIDADMRRTGTILAQAAQTLDFSRPVAVMLFSILQVISNEDDPHAIVATLMDAVPSGSYLALSHVASDIEPEGVSEAASRLNKMAHQKLSLRDHDEVGRFFDLLEMVEPGLVMIEDWRPDSQTRSETPSALWGGVGRKP